MYNIAAYGGWRRSCLWLLGIVLSVGAAVPRAQQTPRYTVPKTENGQPDFQGVWSTAFLTMMERPAGVESLTLTPEQARGLVEQMVANRPKVIDPDALIHDIRQLAIVKGEQRTSVIVDPPDGKLPFTPAGLELATRVQTRDRESFDNVEERPLSERCLENLGYAPMRSVPVFLPRQIVQTRDYVVISSEDSSGPRIIPIEGQPVADSVRSIGGYSVGRWEGDTLVVETSHLLADDPSRGVNGRPLVISRQTRITERFTRVSPTELFYRFTIEDPTLYTQPWSGEFSMTRYDGPIFEYACHEGNYSLTNVLRGARVLEKLAEK
jgi:hypothetical protein